MNYSKKFILIALFFFILPCSAAISCDGSNDWIDFGDSFSFSNNDPFTLSLWVYPGNNTGSVENTIAGFAGAGENWSLVAARSSGANSWGFYTTASGYRKGSAYTPNTSWHHLVLRFDGSDMNLYVNNAEDIAPVNASYSSASSGIFKICRWYTNINNHYYNGKLDDVRLYNRALSATEVEILYKSKRKRIGGSLANGLVAHYEMDDDAIGEIVTPLNDSSGNNNHGEFKNFSNVIAAFNGDVPANIGTGKSLEFDGVDDYISIKSFVNQAYTEGTQSIWFKANATQSLNARLVEMGIETDRIGMFIDSSKKVNAFAVDGGSTVWNFDSNNTLNDDAWHIATMTWKTNEVFLYIDGAKQTANDTSSTISLVNGDEAYLGEYISGGNFYFNGLLDDIRIYNKALTALEVSYLYNGSGMDPGTSNLEALWTFDDFAAVKDVSGNDNHGAGSGGASLKYTEGVLRR